MVPPTRRLTSWTSNEEFQLVFSSLFTSEGSATAQAFGIQRIKVWLKRGSNCPHAVESTANLLEVLLRDDAERVSQASTSAAPRLSQQELRLAYSMALIRFVNSLVDPLQTTYYARSMAALAAQLGLPLWFVELRHAATHEDLPGLIVLRDASRQALDWLYTNYWLPAISQPEAVPLAPLEPLIALLSAYKTLMKAGLRDASKASKTKLELAKLYKKVDAWVVEAEGMGRGRERAVEGVVEAFLQVGSMIPMAKKKRPSLRAPGLSQELVSIWTPILSRMDDTYDGFEDALLARMVDLLAEPPVEPSGDDTPAVDASYTLTLQSWILHFLSMAEEPLATETVVKSCLLAPTPGTLSLLEALVKADESLSETVTPLLSVLRASNNNVAAPVAVDETDSQLDLMDQRMRALEAALVAKPKPTKAGTKGSEKATKGWKLAENWTARPIGALPAGGVAALDLVAPL